MFSILHQRNKKIVDISAFNNLSALTNLNQLTIDLSYLFNLFFKKFSILFKQYFQF